MKIQGVKRRPGPGARGAAERPLILPVGLRAAGPPPGQGGLRVEAAAVSSAAKEVAALRAGLGVPEVHGRDEERILLEVDPRAPMVAQTLVPALPEAPAVERQTGVSAGRLSALVGQLDAMSSFHQTARALDRSLGDGRNVMGTLQRQTREQLRELVTRLLSSDDGAGVRADVLSRLRAAYAPVGALSEQQRAEVAAERDKTQKDNRRAKEAKEALAKREALLRAMLDLRKGQPLDPARAEEAAATYEALQQTEEDRRGNDR